MAEVWMLPSTMKGFPYGGHPNLLEIWSPRSLKIVHFKYIGYLKS